MESNVSVLGLSGNAAAADRTFCLYSLRSIVRLNCA
jgi:hypothetical protein